MKHITYFTLVFCILSFFSSCSDNDSGYFLKDNSFSFIARNIDINISQDDDHFDIIATRENSGSEEIHRVEVYKPQTTAVIGEQVITPDDLSFVFGKKEKSQTLTIKVNSENISEPIKFTLVSFTIPSQKNHAKYNDTLTVNIIPSILNKIN